MASEDLLPGSRRSEDDLRHALLLDGLTGYVYLPGPGEWHYRDNVGTIYRGDQDGKWHPATRAWNSLLSIEKAADGCIVFRLGGDLT